MNNMQFEYSILGGDLRQSWLAHLLMQEGKDVAVWGVPPLSGCLFSETPSLKEALSSGCVVGPIPLSKDGTHLYQTIFPEAIALSEVMASLKPGQTFFAGCIPEGFQNSFPQKGIAVFDLMQEEPLAIRNSIATAEGAICEAIAQSPLNLHHSRCCVLGHGRCGRTLASCLKGMFCHVTVCCNDPVEQAQASLIADRTGNLAALQAWAGEFDFIFSTVPALVITKPILLPMKKTAVIIDIASAPGSTDYEAARELGITALLCPGLPGKYAPASSALYIKEAISSNPDRPAHLLRRP